MVAALPLVLIGHAPGQGYGLVWVAIALFGLTALLLVTVPWYRLPEPARLVVVVVFCLAVAALREAAGGLTGGYGALLILPIVWLAVYGRSFEVMASVALAGLTLVVPILVMPESSYPVSEWRRAVLTMMTFALTGLVVNELVSRIDRHQQRLASVVEATTAFGGSRLGAELCAAVLEAADAVAATYHELDGEHAFVSSADRTGRPTRSCDRARLGAAIARVAAAGVPDEIDQPAAVGADDASHPQMKSMLRHPVTDGDQTFGVLEVGWECTLRQVDPEVRQVIALLAREAAAVTVRNRLIDRLDELAHLDQLTGVLNRRAWDEAFEQEVDRVSRYGGTTTMALIDLDHFKQYNDRFGHLAGDELLVAATAAWRNELRSVDVLARWGGEEFVLLLPATDLVAASSVLDRLRQVTPHGQLFSAGLVPLQGRDPNVLIRAADAALYRAKQGGRNRNEIALAPVT